MEELSSVLSQLESGQDILPVLSIILEVNLTIFSLTGTSHRSSNFAP